MKNQINKIIKFLTTTTWQSDVYSRDGRLIKGFLKMTWHHLLVARISVLIDSNGMVTIVRREGIFYKTCERKLEHIMLDVLEESEYKSESQNRFYFNHVDFQYL